MPASHRERAVTDALRKIVANDKDPKAAITAASMLLHQMDVFHQGQINDLKSMPLAEALWWFIEECSDEDPNRNEYFFTLRERMREYNMCLNDVFNQLGDAIGRSVREAKDLMNVGSWYSLNFKFKYDSPDFGQMVDLEVLPPEKMP